jgi:signal transduction protein with GAF and PtsI domain
LTIFFKKQTITSSQLPLKMGDKMDTYNALGKKPERYSAFTEGLLAEAEDTELQTIVNDAAGGLSTPIALVTLVLERIQFFKAHYGLPQDLAISRATERDVSFCQFVVRDGEPFEVENAEEDEPVPQHLVKRYGVKAYLGIPVMVNKVVTGSLCVIDTKARTFSDDERQKFTELAALVSQRLEVLSAQRTNPRLSLAQRAVSPSFTELRESLELVRNSAAEGRIASSTLKSLLRLLRHTQTEGATTHSAVEREFEHAYLALEDLDNSVIEIEMGTEDAKDCVSALERVRLQDISTARLSDVLNAVQDLSRSNCRDVGGAPLPELPNDPLLATPQPLAVGLLSSFA